MNPVVRARRLGIQKYQLLYFRPVKLYRPGLWTAIVRLALYVDVTCEAGKKDMLKGWIK